MMPRRRQRLWTPAVLLGSAASTARANLSAAFLKICPWRPAGNSGCRSLWFSQCTCIKYMYTGRTSGCRLRHTLTCAEGGSH
ncbi:hypothetical protein PR003_g31169 [Phytophthora rubi]|uniref:Secreted protein n=1 Tax=Phytophthora rubi TaxID=129364 RepID=A0A6A3HBC6_9STRA|nr:hypothetical protein PR002_g28329 [Phytophthora rubi]KAE8966801.1 hypothetical protein PR001_g28287 [Phytophthora rubi]KAE9269358.1 hypothetical protein PR003_g31169 [Phytophthora rubi]